MQLHRARRVGRRDERSGQAAGASAVLAVQLVLARALRLHAAVARREPQVRNDEFTDVFKLTAATATKPCRSFGGSEQCERTT